MSNDFPDTEEDDYHRLIERNRNKIVKHINANVFLDQLREKSVLTADEAEEIHNSPTYVTRMAKAGFFLDKLQTKGDAGLKAFLEILEYEYDHLYEKITHKKARKPPPDYSKHRESMLMNWIYRLPELARDLQRDYNMNKNMDQRLKDMESILRYAQDNNRDLEQDNEELRKKLDKITNEKEALEKRVAECLKESNTLKDQSLKYLAECLELQKESQTSRERLREVMHDRDELERQIMSLRNDLTRSGVDLMNAKRQSIIVTRQMPDPTSQSQEMKQLSQTEIKMKILEEKLEEEYKNREDLSLRLQQATDELDEYQSRYREEREKFEKMKKERDSQEKLLLDKDKRIQDYYQRIIELETQKQKVEAERNNEQAKLHSVSEEKFKLFLEHHRIVDELEKLQSKYDQLKIQCNRNSGESVKMEETEHTEDSPEFKCPRALNAKAYEEPRSKEPHLYQTDLSKGECVSNNETESQHAATLPPSLPSYHREVDPIIKVPRPREKRPPKLQKSNEVSFSDVPTGFLDRTGTVQAQRGEDITPEEMTAVDNTPFRAGVSLYQTCAKYDVKFQCGNKEGFGIQESEPESDYRPRGRKNTSVPQSSDPTSSEDSDDFNLGAFECFNILRNYLPTKPKLPPPKLTGISTSVTKELTVKIRRPVKLELYGGNVIGIFILKSTDGRLNHGDEVLSVSVINESNYSIISTQSLLYCSLEEAVATLDLEENQLQLEVKIRRVSNAESEAIRSWMDRYGSNGDYFFIRCNFSHENTTATPNILSVKRGDVLKVTNTNIQKGHWQVCLWDHVKCAWTKEGIIPKEMRKYYTPSKKHGAFRIKNAPFDRVLPTKVQTKLPVILHGSKDIIHRLQNMMVEASSDYLICRTEEACKKPSETMKMCQQKDKHVLLTDLFLKRKNMHHSMCFIVICLNTERASPDSIHKLFGNDIHQTMEKYEDLSREDIVFETITLPSSTIRDSRDSLLKAVFEVVKRGQERVYWMSENQLDSATVETYKQFLGEGLVSRRTGPEGTFRRSQSLPTDMLS